MKIRNNLGRTAKSEMIYAISGSRRAFGIVYTADKFENIHATTPRAGRVECLPESYGLGIAWIEGSLQKPEVSDADAVPSWPVPAGVQRAGLGRALDRAHRRDLDAAQIVHRRGASAGAGVLRLHSA